MSVQVYPPALRLLTPQLTITSGDPGSSLSGLNTTPIADGAIVQVIENYAEYVLEKSSTAVPDGVNIVAPTTGPGRWIRRTGTGGDAFVFANRVDCSVNSGRVDGVYSSAPILHCQSAGNVAGGFNGGGTGNKSIIGFRVGNLLPLGSLVGFTYTWLDLAPAIPGLPVYVNLVLDVHGDGSAYKIAVVDPASVPALMNGTTVLNLDGSKTTTWTAATDNLLIVNGLPLVIPGPAPPYVPPTVPGAAPPTYGFPIGWPGSSYSIAAILAAYPACRLAEASSLDGGLPKTPNKTPAFMLITGDSINQLIRAMRITNVVFNGVNLT